MNDEAKVNAAIALCAMVGVKPKKIVVVNGAVVIQTTNRGYYELGKHYDKWEFGHTHVVSIDEMNALAASGALNDLLPAPEQPKGIAEKSEERKRWWNQ